jgi:pregnancy-associated plasma protein-A
VEKPTVDKLRGWIAKHPKLAARAKASAALGATVTVQTWIHVIRKDLTVDGGNVPNRWIREQISVLNRSFSGATGGASTGFAFELAGVTRTTNKKWFDLQGGEDKAMKRLLKVGGVETLNIYTANLGHNLLGYAYLAQDAAKVGVLDGVVVHFQSLPGGNFAIYSEGDTATHEVGHWFDLFHTFDGGCTGGDLVDDTAPEASPAFNCPVGRDTCEGDGLDPITNFMDYTQDSCMFEFTPGQAVRMQQAWAAFRAP